ncbi:hypothetical protein EBU71_20100 [bacterium]|nr:hypothetical protein [Candidatus Elulimicrobium humile]
MKIDYHMVLSLFHLLIIVPLLLFVGFQRASTPQWLYMTLLSIGGVVFLYHGIKFLIRYQNQSSYTWVNAIHAFIIAPLLLYIGYHGKETPRFAYELLLMVSFGAAGYHLFSIVKLLEAHPEPYHSHT